MGNLVTRIIYAERQHCAIMMQDGTWIVRTAIDGGTAGRESALRGKCRCQRSEHEEEYGVGVGSDFSASPNSVKAQECQANNTRISGDEENNSGKGGTLCGMSRSC
jgi:predicted component of type VI protein secretion system